MSRARETLHLFSLDSSVNPHISLLNGDFLIRRKPSATIEEQGQVRTYHLLGMEDFFIDFAGIKSEQHPSRLALHHVKAGSVVKIDARNKHLELINNDGISIARLSQKAQAEWAHRLNTIKEIRIIALVRRYKDDLADKEFQLNCIGDRWEVPIVEVIC
jgi:ATP-dependent DNA helicase RecQ